MVELPSIYKTLGSILSTTNKQNNEKKFIQSVIWTVNRFVDTRRQNVTDYRHIRFRNYILHIDGETNIRYPHGYLQIQPNPLPTSHQHLRVLQS